MGETKLMAREDPTSGKLSSVKKYTFNEYDGDATLKELSAMPAVDPPWTYDAGTKTAVAAASSLSLTAGAITVDPDGAGTVDVTITGPVGKLVNVSFSGQLPIDALQYTLVGGSAVAKFAQGGGQRCPRPVRVAFDLDDGTSPVPVYLEVTLS